MLEITVDGTPRSLQGKSADGLRAWKARIRAEARRFLPDDDTRIDYDDVRIRIVHFCFEWPDNGADLDNIAKPIIDAICGIMIFNDNQVKEIVLRRTDIAQHAITAIDSATPLLGERIAAAVGNPSDPGFVYVSAETVIDHGVLP